MSETLSERPIPDARPPHLPDVMTRRSLWVWVFAVVALVQVIAGWRSWAGQFAIPQPDQIPLLAHAVIPSAVVPLLGVALFVRHPDARRRMPLLVFGLGLLTAIGLLDLLDAQITAILIGPEGIPGSPADIAYGVFKSLAGTFGILYLAAGISAARRNGAISAERALAVWFVALAIVGIILSIAGFAQLGIQEASIGDWIAFIAQVALTLVATLAWAYMAHATVLGVVAADSPRRAWILAAIAGVTLFAYRVIAGLFFVLGELAFTIALVIGYVALAAWLLLLAAFAMGFPAPSDAAVDTVDTVDATGDPPAAPQPGSAAG